jgi:hypothetical protein
MKVLTPTDLPGLPSAASDLVADGVYSLYELPTDEPHYVLLTSRWARFYLLSSRGDLMPVPNTVKSVSDLKLGDAVIIVSERGDGIPMNIC